MSKILIAGGSGLVGSNLSKLLIEMGHEVRFLSRSEGLKDGVQYFKWSIETNYIDGAAFENIEHVINLAGAGIADQRWTSNRKREIILSRTKSTDLLFNFIKSNNIPIKSYISASAIGIYGGDTGTQVIDEKSRVGNDFLAEVTKLWEESASQFEAITRVVKIRIGVVMTLDGGALPKIIIPIKLGFGTYLGRGTQYLSWIHIDDLSRIFCKAIADESMCGAYNAVAPNPVTNIELTRVIAANVNRWIIPFFAPAFVFKIIFGEMSIVVLGGSNISCKKIVETGFEFQFRTIESCMRNLLQEKN